MHLNHKQQHQLHAQTTNTSCKNTYLQCSSRIKYDFLSHACSRIKYDFLSRACQVRINI